METDEQLAREAMPAARVFRWDPPAISLGFRQPLPGWLDVSRFSAAGLEVVERPTGGGIAFHGSDVSVAVILPREPKVSPHAALDMVCRSAVTLCESFGVEAAAAVDHPGRERLTCCLTEPSPYAVLIGTRKIAGFALRRYPASWLIQGSLLVSPLPDQLARALPHEILEAIVQRAVSLSEAAGTSRSLRNVAERWAQACGSEQSLFV